jgi:hypothetical protein
MGAGYCEKVATYEGENENTTYTRELDGETGFPELVVKKNANL